MLGSGPVTVGAQRWARDGGRHGKNVRIVGEVKCPIALVEVVGVHGGEGMMGVCRDGFVVRGSVGRGRERIAVVVIVLVILGLGVVKLGRKGRLLLELRMLGTIF